MTTTEKVTSVGVFTERHLADRAIEELHNAGFSSDQIGFVSREGTTEEQVPLIPAQPSTGTGSMTAPIGVAPAYTPIDADVPPPEENKAEATAAGVVGGGVIGGILGAAAALLIPGLGPAIAGGILTAVLGGAAIGAVAGGLIGALTSMGVPEDEARFYQDELRVGRTLVTVKAGDRYDEALAILRHNGAYDATTPRTNTTPTTGTYMSSVPERHVDAIEQTEADVPETSTVPPQTVDQTTDTEIREPEVPPQPTRMERAGTNTPPPIYNTRP